ncbi:MAG TPA: double-strand break repair helicase AddA [Alphaproteobacteria bacterium]|nr:double-strand break repair helicase AddA [Alphaproteobacteria bacterium]
MSTLPLSVATDETDDALRPDRTVWVAASAGAGKTTILTRRVLSLLVHGTPPGRILCLTFTKAAAAEMQNRINARLSGWAAADATKLDAELRDLLGRAASAAERRIARRLFAQVLDVPGGMKIQTIHAFCQSLLRRFPVESGLAPHFEVMDERTAAELMLAARDDLLRHARRDPGGLVGRAWATVTAETNEEDFSKLMQGLAAKRGRLKRLFENRGIAGAQGVLRARLGLQDGETSETILAAGVADTAFDLAGLRGVTARLAGGSDPEQQRAAILADYLAAPEQRAAKFGDYCQVFLTKEGATRARLINKGTAGNTDAPEVLQREAERLVALCERLRAAKLADVGAALLTLAGDQLAAYERHKARRAALDYDDLILKTRDLLRGDGDLAAGAAAWVLFKLDGGLDHILVDEAQDTSPEQWEVVSALAEEFFAGEGARERPRTVFVVGDLKQSIYSFQGADPDAFLRMRGHFQDRAQRAAAWRETDLLMSYRSTGAVLRAVDAVFAGDPARVGVAENGQTIKHNLKRIGQAGLVELWPSVMPEPPAEVTPWASPTETQAGDSPQSRLASVIAAQIAAWIGREQLPSYGRSMRAGDIMILVRRRTGFVSELVRDLKSRGVPVAGVDRMVLTEQLAVMDLVAFGQFLLLPEDDLTLATVLKSPLVGLSEDQLFEIAHGRSRASLWEALSRRAARDKGAFKDAHDLLARYLGLADYARPYELYGELLGRDGGRRKILARLGAEAEDAVAEFLNRALGYEREAAPSLQGFLHWFAAGEAEIKRDLEQSLRDEVRIMTVHGAKGLQAPVVILPDTMQVPSKQDALLWTVLAGEEDAPGARILPLWPPRTADDEAVAAAERAEAKRRAQEEYRRLLYVALTRAEDRLYVCGWQGKTAPSPDCWYNLVQSGLQALVEEGEAAAAEFDFTALTPDGWSGAGLRLAHEQSREPDKAQQNAGEAPMAPAPLEDWARLAAKPEERPSRPLAPSKPEAGEAEPAMLSPFAQEDDGARFLRGVLIHRLLQSLPELAFDLRADAAARYLARPLWNLNESQQRVIAAEALRVLGDARFAELFGPGSRAEVSITGRVGERAVSGQIDRLVALEDRVLIVDYKSNRPPPTRVEDVPLAYLRQLAAYRALLAQIYAGKRIDCALLWTDGPLWMEIPAELLDAQVLPG